MQRPRALCRPFLPSSTPPLDLVVDHRLAAATVVQAVAKAAHASTLVRPDFSQDRAEAIVPICHKLLFVGEIWSFKSRR